MMRERRILRGHGSIYRGTALALPHVGYSLSDPDEDGTLNGFLRGDPHVLRPMAMANERLLLVLEDGRRLPFRLRDARLDGLTWEVTGYGLPHP